MKLSIALAGALVGLLVGGILVAGLCAVGWRFHPEVWGTIAQWGSAVGTTCAVVVAIWGDALRRFILRPRLELRLDNPTGVEVPTSARDAHNIPMMPILATWLHVNTSNPTRWFSAEDVEVYLLRVEQKQQGKWIEAWVGPSPLSWRHGELPTRNFRPPLGHGCSDGPAGRASFRDAEARTKPEVHGPDPTAGGHAGTGAGTRLR